MSMFKLYLLFFMLPNLSGFFTVISIVSVLFIGTALLFDDSRDAIFESWGNAKFKKWKKIFLLTFTISAVMAVFLPDQESVTKMYVANYVTTNSQIKQLPKVVVEYLKNETKENE